MVLPWWSIFTRKLTIASVEMTDWDMLIETWPSSPAFPNGRHNFPKFTRDSKSTGPKRFTTTLRSMLASRGSFTYEDHGTPWGVAARDLRISLSRGVADTAYLGRASFSDSTITIQKYEPFPREHAVAVHHRRIEASLQPDRSRQRRGAVGAHRRHRHGPLARTDLSDLVEDRFSGAEEHLLPSRQVPALGQGRLPRHVPPVQGRARAEGHVQQSAPGRERLAVPRPARLRAVGAGSDGGDERDEPALWRHRRIRLPAGAAQQAGRSHRRVVGGRLHRRRPRAADGLPRNEGPAAQRPRDGAESPRLEAREVVRETRRGRSHRQPAGGDDADDAGAASGTARAAGGASAGAGPVR